MATLRLEWPLDGVSYIGDCIINVHFIVNLGLQDNVMIGKQGNPGSHTVHAHLNNSLQSVCPAFIKAGELGLRDKLFA